jgi:hypothetical protein
VTQPATSIRLRASLLAVASALAAGVLTGCGGGGGGATAATDPATAAAVPVGAAATGTGVAPTAALPSLKSVSPSLVTPPARVVLSGEGFDEVESVRLGDIVLPIISRTATSIEVDVPAGATTQFLTLVDRSAAVRSTPQVVSIDPPAVVTSVSPEPVLAGSVLTVGGSGFERIREVVFAGEVRAAVQSPTGGTLLRVSVPFDAQSGPLGLVSSSGRRFDWSGALTVIPRIRVPAPVSVSVAAGATVAITGSGLDEVSRVTVAGLPATLGVQTATRLEFAAPVGGCGAVSLESNRQPAVFGGTVSIADCTIRLESIEYAQVQSQPDADVRQRLVPRRETWVRAFMVSAQSGVSAPALRLDAYLGNTLVGSRAMSGPSQLPVLAVGAPIPSSLRGDGAQTFLARLDDTWVTPGLRVEISVDASAQGGGTTVTQDTPKMGADTKLTIVLVPLHSGPHAPVLDSDLVALTLDEITRRFPIARDRIAVSMRAPYMLTSVTDGVDANIDWSDALNELEQLRAVESTSVHTHYYGLVPPLTQFGIAGVGYLGGWSAMGIHEAGDPLWMRIMTHELGHNFNRDHAPCGVSGDASYPYPNGALGPTPLFDVTTDQVVSSTGKADVMGYCNGDWFSDYSYAAIQAYLEARPQMAPFVTAAFGGSGSDGASDLVLVSGSIGLAGSRIDAVQAARGVPRVPPGGEFVLRLHTAAGGRFDVPFDAAAVDHASPPQRHFQVLVPDPGPLSTVEVLRDGVRIVARESAPAEAGAEPKSLTPATVSVAEAAGALTVTWDAARHPTATVVHVAPGGGRTGLAVRARGGLSVLRTDALPAGGAFEIALSDGLNTERTIVAR